MLYTFLYSSNTSIVFDAVDCKHYSSHAALTDAVVVSSSKIPLLCGRKYTRFNVAFGGDLIGMYPENSKQGG